MTVPVLQVARKDSERRQGSSRKSKGLVATRELGGKPGGQFELTAGTCPAACREEICPSARRKPSLHSGVRGACISLVG